MGKEKYTETISIRITSEMLEKLNFEAKELEIDRTELIRFAIANFIGAERGNKLNELEKTVEAQIKRNDELEEKLNIMASALHTITKLDLSGIATKGVESSRFHRNDFTHKRLRFESGINEDKIT